MALIATIGAAADDAAGITMADAGARVEEAIAFGTIVAQQAPPGHAIFAALEEARAVQAFLADQIPWYASAGPWLLPSSRTYAAMQAAIDRIHDAAATVRTDPDQPLPATIYESQTRPPWGLIAAGAAGLSLVAILALRARAGRRRRR